MQYILVWEFCSFCGFPSTCTASGRTGTKSFVLWTVTVPDAGVASKDAGVVCWKWWKMKPEDASQ
jgi:hypothetical protein